MKTILLILLGMAGMASLFLGAMFLFLRAIFRDPEEEDVDVPTPGKFYPSYEAQ